MLDRRPVKWSASPSHISFASTAVTPTSGTFFPKQSFVGKTTKGSSGEKRTPLSANGRVPPSHRFGVPLQDAHLRKQAHPGVVLVSSGRKIH